MLPPLFPCGGLVGGEFPVPPVPHIFDLAPPPEPPGLPGYCGPPGTPPPPQPVDVIPAGPGLKLDGLPSFFPPAFPPAPITTG